MAALADDDELDDFYRPEVPARPRASSRASKVSARQASYTADFADMPRRANTKRFDDPYDDPSFLPDADQDDDRTFLRARRRVPVRKSGLLASRWGRIGLAGAALAVVGLLIALFLVVRGFFLNDSRFRIESAQSIQLVGNTELTRNDLLSIFGADVGHNLFSVPLAGRRAALQQLPWVEHATVMRLLPNQLRISIVERVPAAFIRTGSKVQLVDGAGMLLTMPPAMLARRHYSFPVVTGINAADPLETRAERMQLYQKFIADLDSLGTRPAVSSQISQVDVTNPEDVRAIMPSAGSDITVHFGDENFAGRYKVYQDHLAQWRQQYPHLAAIDLRYDHATVLDTDQGAAGNSATAIDAAPALAAAPHKSPARPAVPSAARPATRPAAKLPARPAAGLATRSASSASGTQRTYATPRWVSAKPALQRNAKGRP